MSSMDQASPTPPPPLADEALGAVMQLAQAASRHEGELGGDQGRGGDASRHGKGRSREMGDSSRPNKQVRMDNEHGQGVDQALQWPTAPPPAYGAPHDPHGAGASQPSPYGGHGLDQNGMQLGHSDAPFDPSAHGVGGPYGDVDDNTRMGPPSDGKQMTSESTGLVGARGKTGMTRALSTSRRAEQNRNAQRVFRERKNKYIADLENKAASLENALLAAEDHRRRFNDAIETIEILKRDNDTLRVALRALGGHQAVPNAPALPLDRPTAHAQGLLPYGTPGRGHQGEHDTQHPHAGGPGGPGGLHEVSDSQDPATAAAVAAAASGQTPYWLLEAVSGTGGQHGFPVPSHFQPSLGDNMGAGAPGAPGHQIQRGAPGQGGQRPEGMIDPSLEQNRLGGLENNDEQRHGVRDEGKGESVDSSGNPDNLASLSAVAAAAAAASSQKQPSS